MNTINHALSQAADDQSLFSGTTIDGALVHQHCHPCVFTIRMDSI